MKLFYGKFSTRVCVSGGGGVSIVFWGHFLVGTSNNAVVGFDAVYVRLEY